MDTLFAGLCRRDGTVVMLPELHRLSDIFRPCYHTILLIPADIDQTKGMARGIELDSPPSAKLWLSPDRPNECDDDGRAFRGYHIGKAKPRTYVMRPDDFLGAIVEEEDWSRQYFNGVFGPGLHPRHPRKSTKAYSC
ncbi:hypothetical protein BDN67DRAFT_984010 [Paxillus ammoniavirescens]|nr:hypothetical protein BDN67DRAFT_984010 [Paxillus ammoniavirescens]